MILVVLGTHELPFPRILHEVEALIKEGYIQDNVIVQNGNTNFESAHMTLRRFIPSEEMEKLFQEAEIVISHAGTGSVTTALKYYKKTIVVPRLKKHGEHNDDHQLQLTESFTSKGHVISMTGEKTLKQAMEELTLFEPTPFHTGNEQMLKTIKNYIDSI
ncbi:PssE/Cps14G family polysaccharide biosynthesis glycosyltransferase [Marinococcus halophilus]|uniref:PssE/Cps14G family polysaccharide biosynthesis glycosyltransferase n=1 Tax=Marinococcus halophilus TaxID=1371 RepID=UPI0009A84590|nr:PssE/Cps14G family polysaccharide biosynthesis glycosyltransferase [Marinococcus halophilus]